MDNSFHDFNKQFTQVEKNIGRVFKLAVPLAILGALMGLGLTGALIWFIIRLAAHL